MKPAPNHFHRSVRRWPTAYQFYLRSVSVVVLTAVVLCASPFFATANEKTEYQETPIDEFDRGHWSFQPVRKPAVPRDAFPDWSRNEIDHFVGASLAEADLKPQPSATPQTLLRRISLDLVGLPPTPSQINTFLSRIDDHSYDRLADELLASPAHGERWAQHWLDLARFAETDGFEHDRTRPNAWKYRDWVINALNDDMPYDEFIQRQIAGDELYPADESASTATQFCLSGPDMPDINLMDERRHTLLNEMTSMIGETILGLQVGCAQCHDHKHDPVSQADFYRLRAIFEPALQLKKNVSVSTLQELFPWNRPSHLMLRGDFRRPDVVVHPGVLRVLAPADHQFEASRTETSAGRRTALAEWLVSKDNPLTARVVVNRVWQHHFGRGLVDSPSDFGIMGSEPTHAALLDWLSSWLMENDWSIRSLHRMIVTSATYRQRSRLPAAASETERAHWGEALRQDPDCAMLSRYPRWRLEGEAIRDAMLVAAGQLNRRAGGPGVRPPLPAELLGTLLKKQWTVTPDRTEHDRRSIYVFARRNLRYPIFEVFDRPSANASCASRGVTTTAPQALHLLNSAFSLRMAGAMAATISDTQDSSKPQIDAAFLRTFGRLPTQDELTDVEQFLTDQSVIAARPEDPLTHLCLSLINSNEFVFVD